MNPNHRKHTCKGNKDKNGWYDGSITNNSNGVFVLDGELYRAMSELVYRHVGWPWHLQHPPRKLVKLRRHRRVVFMKFDLCFRCLNWIIRVVHDKSQRNHWHIRVLFNSGSLLASWTCFSKISATLSILPCCRLICARVATATSHSRSMRRASLQHRSAAPISCFHWNTVRSLFTRGRTLASGLAVHC